MARLNQPTAEGLSTLYPYFNTIQGALEEGATNQELFAIVKEAAGIGPDQKIGASIFDMNFVAGQARAINNSSANLENAIAFNGDQAVDSTMWAWAPWAEPSVYANQNPSYIIRYEYTAQDQNGQLVTLWGQTDWQGPLEGSANDVYDRALTSAQETINNPSPHARTLIAGLVEPSVLDVTGLQILRT